MTSNRLLDLVDARDFRTLFIDELGWNNPDRPDITLEVNDQTFALTQVAGYKGLRIWHCPVLPVRKSQRMIDVLVGKDNHERLVIFSNEHRQEWRWPRRAQLGSANAKLLVHEHVVGDHATHLTQRLQAIELDFDEDITLVALLDKMRDAFDHEAETASVAAARLMGTLYTELEIAGVGEQDATLLLARILFLLFGDDADMWKPAGLFEKYLREHTTSETLHEDLKELFDVLDTDEKKRTLASDSPYAAFRYINGGLFHDPLRLPKLTPEFREALLAACEFDWSIISPAVFGSMFQTVKSKDSRRSGGEHYTTEENILKTIRPLFLDEYRDRLERGWNDKSQLTRLHNDLGRSRFMDPACGCGNFLVVAYRELRAIEHEILKRRRDLDMVDALSKKVERAQLSLDVTGDIKVTLDHFYGIEIEEWPARIAETAMLLVDHLANQQMAVEFGVAPDRLPIAIAPTIYHGNALQVDWRRVLPPSDEVYVFGNPPWLGISLRSEEQTADLQTVWRDRYHGTLDYVTGWHAKTLEYLQGTTAQWAFVTTNSVTQGEAVAPLFEPIFDEGWRIKFAHRTFKWTSEATGQAAVHCAIIGFAKKVLGPRLFDYPKPDSSAVEIAEVGAITPYLTPYHGAGRPVIVHPVTRPLNRQLGEVAYGNKPTDGGYFIVDPDEYEQFAADPIAAKYLRRYVGARELLHNNPRYCLWLVDLKPSDLKQSSLLRSRVDGVREFRLSSKAASTRKAAETPHLFRQIAQPSSSYLCIPRHVSENRPYFLSNRFSADVICSDANFLAADADGFVFAIMSSGMFIEWQRAVGGRLESRLRFNKLLTWNTFPLPPISKESRSQIIAAGEGVLAARQLQSEQSLADLYEPTTMSAELRAAHSLLDSHVDKLFGIESAKPSALERQDLLFEQYRAITDPLSASSTKGRSRKPRR
ncbi:DNA methyltransferase [Gordonia sp. p3-SID1431]|uniref:class I SAM-dependent DNA methyltransferase n=1 Tax=Gordonia sp. p3-SID1431 TaxID=2916159 RepID=UPI0021A5C7DC|nr:DNA methyltransferase [Gordonia sp. p3-SID1431]MCT1355203.1 class I SAM-dependent DNA methyltransferase [Gordonia sp. p3-SID1431]